MKKGGRLLSVIPGEDHLIELKNILYSTPYKNDEKAPQTELLKLKSKNKISDKFDIYHNYYFNGRKFVIYAYCYNHNNRFETSGDESKLWDTRCFEHLFFINSDNLDMHTLNNLKDFAINSIEPHFVRGDGKYPVKHHLYSHISFIIITRNKPSYEVEEAIKNITWNKSYMFSAKGYCNLKMVCVTPREYSVIANENAKDIKDFLMDILLHIDHYED